MRVSINKKNINPIISSYLSGQINRVSKHTGILDAIYCTSLILEINKELLCFIAYDLLQFDEYLSNRIRDSISSHTEILKSNIFTIPSHTHAGPEVLRDGLFGIKTASEVAEGYLDFLVNTSLNCVNESLDNLLECTIHYSEVSIEGYYGNRNDPTKPSDKDIRIIQFNHEDKTIALFVNLACHPTILGAQNTLISSDLMGVIRKGLEERYNCPVMMTNGAEGDISNRHYRIASDESELVRTGNGILNQIPKQLDTKILNISKFMIYQKKFQLICSNDTQRIEDAIQLNNELIQKTTNQDALKLLNATNTVLVHRLKMNIPNLQEIEYSIIDMGEIIICSLPMELFSSLFLSLKKQVDCPIIILGLTNTSIGYCVDEAAYEQTYEGLTSLFVRGEGERFIESLVDEIKQIRRNNRMI